MSRTTSNRGRWRRVEALLDELLDFEPEERAAAVRRAARARPEVAEEAARLLAAMEEDAEAGDLLASPLVESHPELVREATAHAVRDRAGDRLGAYRLLEVLGRGGMGVVYRAERADDEFEQQVAIKLIPRGLESEAREQRFRLERQVLARLTHPGIARLLDGGVTGEGYPYLVMELVEGRPIDEYCDHAGLGLRERLRLFLEVCDAVQHAHQNLVIHRDLKPDNILVTANGEVRLLDFGVAKLAEEEVAGVEPTRFQPRTAAWASPEQLADQPVSTASDVFSLGAVLYRVLTGRLPRDAAATDSSSTESGAARGARVPPAASRAALEGGRDTTWSRRLRGDLDRILAKALATESGERYATAAALADDLSRFLEGQPVSARAPTAAYRTGKFVARHRVAVVATLAGIVALAAATVAALWQAERARASAQRAERVADLLGDLFTDANPYAATSEEVSVREILDRGVGRVRSELADDPETRAELLARLAAAYNAVGLFELGLPLLEEVLEDRRRRWGASHPITGETIRRLGFALYQAGDLARARELARDALDVAEDRHGRDATETREELFLTGLLESDDPEAQAETFGRVASLYRQAEEESPGLARALSNLASSLDNLGREEEAFAALREALEVAELQLPEGHPDVAMMRNNLALHLQARGDYGAAEKMYRRALEMLEARLGPGASGTAIPLVNLGRMHMLRGDFEAARLPVERAEQILVASSPPSDFRRLAAEINRATLDLELGRVERAEAVYRDALGRMRDLLGEEHQATARTRSLLGGALWLQGRFAAAEEELRAALATQRRAVGAAQAIDETLLALGRLLIDVGRPDEAEGLLEEALALRESNLPAGHWRLAEVRVELAALAVAGEEAPTSRGESSLEESRRVLADLLPPDNFRRARLSGPGRGGSGP